MQTIYVEEDTPIEAILGLIEEETKKQQLVSITLSFSKGLGETDRKKTVETIKKYFDLFIVLETDFPRDKQKIEEYFSYGLHGIFFETAATFYTKEEYELMAFATELFSRGWIFASAKGEKTVVDKLLALKIVPVVSKKDVNGRKIIDYIKAQESFKKLAPGLIKSMPLMDEKQGDYSITDKIKMKMLLETMNLRQKLMVKSIDESFESSGL